MYSPSAFLDRLCAIGYTVLAHLEKLAIASGGTASYHVRLIAY
ncbi:hypothetical protein [Nostoc sp.]